MSDRLTPERENEIRQLIEAAPQTASPPFAVKALPMLIELLAALDACRRDLDAAAKERNALYTQADLDFFADGADDYFDMLLACRRDLAEERAKTERLVEALNRVLDPEEGVRLEGLVLSGWAIGTGLDNAMRLAREAIAECGAGTEKPA